VYVAPVAPGMAAAFSCHAYVRTPLLALAATENVTGVPTARLALRGCVVMVGGVMKVRVPSALVTDDTGLDTMQWTFAEASAAAVVKVYVLRPPAGRGTSTEFLTHWYVTGPVPVNPTEKVTEAPTTTEVLAGGAVMTIGARTVTLTGLLRA
jgi:hypothetical protein